MTDRDLAQDWCRMWNDEPALAHDLVTDDFRMWLGANDRADALRGPADLEEFVARYRDAQGVRFEPRVVVAGVDGLGYTWDARFPDGTVRTGVDLNTLHDGRIAENRSTVGERACDLDADGAHRDARPADARTLWHDWTPLWNGELERAPEVVSPGFRIWFAADPADGDDVSGPDDFAGYIARHLASRPGLEFATRGEPVIDAGRDRAAFAWTATLPGGSGSEAGSGASTGRSVGGIDVFQFGGARVDRAWSFTGTRPFTF